MGKPVKRKKSTNDSAARVRKHRDKMRAMGLKPVTLWLPDTDAPEYREKIRKACEAINASADSNIVLDGMMELADWDDWKA